MEKSKPKTVIQAAREWVLEKGKEGAIKEFEDRIQLAKDNDKLSPFEKICKISGLETAIEYINENH